jgi:4-hydroxysphinganine ceramide fatty acyl 2-hydroxylase
VVPVFWGPIATYLLLRSVLQFSFGPNSLPLFSTHPALPLALLPQALTLPTVLKVAACFFSGNIIWTMLEYGLHRFLFHIDDWLPDHPLAILLHFTMHGVHHYLPMDR